MPIPDDIAHMEEVPLETLPVPSACSARQEPLVSLGKETINIELVP